MICCSPRFIPMRSALVMYRIFVLVSAGTPERIAAHPRSHTGRSLVSVLGR
jgi:hypothetical protein